MKIYKIDHIQLSIPPDGEGKARAFYINILGFREVQKPADLAKRGGVWFEQGDVKLHLGVEENFRAPRKAHPALLVDNLDELIQLITNAELSVDTSQPSVEGFRRAHVLDPFGNRLEFLQKQQLID